MKILSIDTASNICGVSILENDKLICNLDTDTGRTHSENLMPMIEQAFNKTNLSLKNIDLITCDIGPGSFTGIRIGVATTKAFNCSLNIPCVGVSSLETLAYNLKGTINENDVVCSIIDCKNDNCYFASYEKKNNVLETLIEPLAESVESCLSILKSYCEDTLENPSIYFIGDGSVIYKSFIQETFPSAKFTKSSLNNLNSYSLGLAGLDYFNSGSISEEVLPLYLKKPQAQRLLEEKEKKGLKFMDIKTEEMTITDLNNIKDNLKNDFDDFWNYNVLKEEIENNNSKYIVTKIDNNVVGFAGIKIIIDKADIMNIVTKKSYRNQGIGTLLLEKLILIASDLQLASISLEVNEENLPAIHIYEKFGFKKLGIRKNYYQNKNAIIMTKKLN